MAQKKLLSLVILLVISIINLSSFGMNNDETWVKNLNSQALNMTWQNLLDLAQGSNPYGENYDHKQINKAGKIMVFVSTSMPTSLLKVYAKEAKTYGAILMFKGLPDNSFKALSHLVMNIYEDGGNEAMQLDDEAFDKYEVKLVPTIVLAKEEDCMPSQVCKVEFDKIVGNIGLKSALEQFAKDGELETIAKEKLKNDAWNN